MNNVSQYEENGFFTIKSFFTKKHMDKVRESLNKIADKSYSDMIHPHEKSKEVKKLIFDEKLNKLVFETFGCEHDAVQSQLRYKKPYSDGFPLHQDDFWTRAGFGNTLNVLIHVDDANKQNGCIYVYPKSHKPPFFSEKVNLTADSGDITFLHNFVLHGSDKNMSDKFRTNLLLMYVKKDIEYRVGKSAKRQIISNV
jgi:ectoine hydroxylase-related dioxygenase (phytanoyl-CoA dioxygenase family)